jgi:hypothetical protein
MVVDKSFDRDGIFFMISSFLFVLSGFEHTLFNE